MQDPEAGVPLSDHKSRLKTYKHCFAGKINEKRVEESRMT